MKKSKNMKIEVTGELSPGTGSKDVVLAIIGEIGTAGGGCPLPLLADVRCGDGLYVCWALLCLTLLARSLSLQVPAT